MHKYIILFFSLLPLFSCESGPESIRYGSDACHLCKMVIMDENFGAEFITEKGKVFKFDSDECLLDFLKANPGEKYRQLLVTDYARPGTLTDASKAIYLHSPNIQSPMGRNLASFASHDDALNMQGTMGGELIHWEHVQIWAR